MYQLPPLPASIRVLKQEESERLKALYSDLPTTLDHCVTCSGKKEFDWWDHYGNSDMKVVTYECPCADQFLLYKFFLNAGLGKQAARAQLMDAIDLHADVLAKYMDYVDSAEYYVSRGIGLLFHGDHGNGKTLTSYLITKRLLANGIDGYFTTFTQMLDSFASGWMDEKQRAWFDKRVRNAPFLVVDDIGREHKNRVATASSSLDSIFRSRVQNALPTIITTNLTLDQFERSYSSGVMSLLTENSLTQAFIGEDWRPKQRKRTEDEIRLKLVRPIVVE